MRSRARRGKSEFGIDWARFALPGGQAVRVHARHLHDVLQGGSVPFFVRRSNHQMDERHYRLMRLLDENPEMSQRELARRLGISLGKVNYCLKELIKRGCVKVGNFTNSDNKVAYMYLLTPRGIEHKAKLTMRFLQLKMREYELLRDEIEQMQREAMLVKGYKPGKAWNKQ